MLLRALAAAFLGVTSLALSVGYLAGLTLNPGAVPMLAIACALGCWGLLRDRDR